MSKARQPSSADEPDGQESKQEAVSTDEAFEVLSNQRRRLTLHYLKRENGRVDLGELSERVASWENETTLGEVDSTERKRVYTSLQSHHLPKMDEQGVVDYDERAGEIELNDSGEELDVYLEIVGNKDVPWSQYYLGLGAVNAALVTAAAVGAWPLAALSSVGVAAFVVTTLLVSAVIHVYHDSVQRLGEQETPPEIDP